MSRTEPEPEPTPTFITIEIKDMLNHGGELGTAMVNFLTEKLVKDIYQILHNQSVKIQSELLNKEV